MTHALARCSYLLRPQLTTCNLRFIDHEQMPHPFQARFTHKAHIPWNDVFVYCGRTVLDNTEVLDNANEAAVRQIALDNGICTACFKQWMFIRERSVFLLSRRMRAVPVRA